MSQAQDWQAIPLSFAKQPIPSVRIGVGENYLLMFNILTNEAHCNVVVVM